MNHKAPWLVAVAALLSLLSGCHSQDAKSASGTNCVANTAESKQAWKRFRAANPYHAQGIALSSPSAEGCRTLVIAEPPPQASVQSITDVAPTLLSHHRVEQHRVGFDGWTKDLVVTLPPMEQATIDELVSALHENMFGTTYKSYVLPILDAAPLRRKAVDLDVRVTHEELTKWLDSKENYRAVEGGAPVTLKSLLGGGEPGVYLSASPGLVAWALPRQEAFDEHLVEARQFVLDSDLLIGAAASDEMVLLLGRERVVPVEVLPPLRVETLVLLASVRQDKVQQSYERNNVFAGRLKDRWDWAPIYLSDELHDTELGSLLNITDQFLKSWSENGMVRYFNFAYPDPPKWAFNKPLFEEVGASSLIYNWNTRGYGASVEIGNREILGFRSTAALPVMYKPGEEQAKQIEPYEERGYEFFASQSDPNLVRVAQYTAIYQTFQTFGIRSGQIPAKSLRAGQDAVLKNAAFKMLKAVRDATPEKLEKVSNQVAAELQEPGEDPKVVAKSFQTVAGSLQGMLQRVDDDKLDRVATQLGQPRLPPGDVDSLIAKLIASELSKVSFVLTAFVDPAAIKDAYAKAAVPREGTWIHTPSIVLSRNREGKGMNVGGHNIDSRVARVVADERTPRGAPLVVRAPSGEQLTFVHPADLGKLQLNPKANPDQRPREAKTALKRPDNANAVSRGAPVSRSGGWAAASTDSETRPAPIGNERVIQVSFRDGVYEIRSSDEHAITARTLADARDATIRLSMRYARGGTASRVIAKDFPGEGEARGFMHSVALRHHANTAVVRGLKSAKSWSSDRFDLGNVVVKKTSVDLTPTPRDGIGPETASLGRGKPHLQIDFEIVSMKGQTKTKRFMAWMKKTSKAATDKVRDIFHDVCAKLGRKKGGATIEEMARAMRRELEMNKDKMGLVVFEFENETGDGMTVRLDNGNQGANDG